MVMMVVMMIQLIVVIVIGVRAVMMMVMMPPTVMVTVIIAVICAGSPRMSAMGHERRPLRLTAAYRCPLSPVTATEVVQQCKYVAKGQDKVRRSTATTRALPEKRSLATLRLVF
jgi:hypothetical protein